MRRDENYKADLLEDLRNDPEYAAEYLTAARSDSKEAFLVALRDVAEARKGMKKVAKEANVNRENLYRALSRRGNPRVETVDSVLEVLGMGVRIFAKAVSAITGNIPATPTPEPMRAEANTVKISDNPRSKRRFASAWTTTVSGNLAATPTGRVFVDKEPTSLRQDVLVCLIAEQISEKQEAAQGKI